MRSDSRRSRGLAFGASSRRARGSRKKMSMAALVRWSNTRASAMPPPRVQAMSGGSSRNAGSTWRSRLRQGASGHVSDPGPGLVIVAPPNIDRRREGREVDMAFEHDTVEHLGRRLLEKDPQMTAPERIGRRRLEAGEQRRRGTRHGHRPIDLA